VLYSSGRYIKDRLERRAYKNREKKEPAVFKVKKEHLKEQVSIEDVETLEVVKDPLGTAPEIPFGHFNSAWQEFKRKIQPGNEIWSFSAEWIPKWGSKELKDGYVIVQNNTPKKFFIASIKHKA